MRIWKGIELEGKHKGKLTLFVESESISYNDVKIIKTYLTSDVEVLYLGAGRVDTISVHDYLFDNIQCYVKQETTPKNLCYVELDKIDECIIRVDSCTPTVYVDKLVMKFDNKTDVFVSDKLSCLHHTSLASLHYGQFTGVDELLYTEDI